jgi:hypothetical protein
MLSKVQTLRLETKIFLKSKIFQTWYCDREFQKVQLSFCEETQIPKRFKPFWGKSINSSKFCLDMIFNTVNLDWHTCIQKFEVPHKWQIELERKSPKRVQI